MNLLKLLRRGGNDTATEPMVATQGATGSVLELWSAPPTSEAYLNEIALSGGRVWLMFFLAGLVWAAVVNYDRPWVVASFSTLLIVMTVITSKHFKISSSVRLGGLAIVIILLAETAFLNNGDVVIGCLMVMPAAIVITTAFGGRQGIIWLTVVNGCILWQAYLFEFQPLSYILRMVPLAMLWSLLMATWTMMLVRHIDTSAQRIQLLRDKERNIYSTINQELAEPLHVLARLVHAPDLGSRDAEAMRLAADSLSHTISSLGPAVSVSPGRPSVLDSFCPATVISQLRVQHAPTVERWSKTLVTDASASAQLIVKGDLFRLRIILSNILRTASMLSDGSILWLNVRGTTIRNNSLITFDIESNGYPMDTGSLASMLQEGGDVNVGAAASLAGLRLAKTWAEEMGGCLELFKSPRGGNGFRVTQTFPLETALESSLLSTADTAQVAMAQPPKTAVPY